MTSLRAGDAVINITPAVGPASGSAPTQPVTSFGSASGMMNIDLNGASMSMVVLGHTPEAKVITELATDLWLLGDFPLRYRIWAVWQDFDKQGDNRVSFQGITYERIVNRRLFGAGGLTYTDTDIGTILWGAIQHTQAKPGGDLGITAGSIVTGITASVDWLPGENIGTKVQDLMNANGCYWVIDENKVLQVYVRADTVPIAEPIMWGAQAESLQRAGAGANFANSVFGSGTSQTTPLFATSPDIATDPRGLWEVAVSRPSETIQANLDDAVAGELALRLQALSHWNVTYATEHWIGAANIRPGGRAKLVVPKDIAGPISPPMEVTVECVSMSLSFTGDGKLEVKAVMEELGAVPELKAVTGTSQLVLGANGVAAVDSAPSAIDITSAYDIEWGYAEQQGLTGGKGQSVYTVTSLANSGAGTLRDALSASNRYIVFDDSIAGGTITLTAELEADVSNVTVDAIGQDITITNERIRFVGGTNIIVAGLNFVDNDATTDTDGLTFREPDNEMVFGVYFCTFSGVADGSIDTIWNQGNDVYGTIVGCYVTSTDKASLVHSGSSTPGLEGGAYYMTYAGVVWDDFKQRCVFARDAHLHQYNNLIRRYADEASGGTPARMADGTAEPPPSFTDGYFAENNVVFPRDVGETTWTGATVTNPREPWFSSNSGSSTSANMKADGTFLMTNGGTTATESEHNPGNVFTPPYSTYPLATANQDLYDWFAAHVAGDGWGAGLARKTTLATFSPDVPAAGHMFISNGDTISVLVEDGSPSAVALQLDGTPIAAMVDQGGGVWTATLSGLTVGDSGDLRAVATHAQGTLASQTYPALVV